MIYDVAIDGTSVSQIFAPNLVSLTVEDKAGTSTDTATVVLDNTAGRILLPPPGRAMSVAIAGVLVFVGTVDDVRTKGSRSAGSLVTIKAKGFDTSKGVKQPRNKTFRDKTIKEIIEEAGALAGIGKVLIDEDLADLSRKFEVMDNESFIAFGERISREIGGVFKVRNDAAVMAKKGSGRSPTGDPLPTVFATYGGNLHSYDVAPFLGRDRYSKIEVRYYDRKAGAWKVHAVETELEGAEATSVGRFTAPDLETAKQIADAKKADAEQAAGVGSVVMECAPAAMAEGTLVLIGAHGANGAYRIQSVSHRIGRGGGSVTSCSLAYPISPNALVSQK